MHELAIAESVVETVTQRLPDAKITRVHLEIGALSGVVADSIRFCWASPSLRASTFSCRTTVRPVSSWPAWSWPVWSWPVW